LEQRLILRDFGTVGDVYFNQRKPDVGMRDNRENLLFFDTYIPTVVSIAEFHYKFACRVTRVEQFGVVLMARLFRSMKLHAGY
jgi:hypothetical protein